MLHCIFNVKEEDGARFLFKTPKVSLSKEQQEKQRAARAEAEAQKERAKRRQSKRKKQVCSAAAFC